MACNQLDMQKPWDLLKGTVFCSQKPEMVIFRILRAWDIGWPFNGTKLVSGDHARI